MDQRKILGEKGELIAEKLLREEGYQILKKNYRNRYGEIDIIAQDKEYLCFVEVRMRTSEDCGTPEESITMSKQNQIIKVAKGFICEQQNDDFYMRFDVVTIEDVDNINSIQLIRNAFEVNS